MANPTKAPTSQLPPERALDDDAEQLVRAARDLINVKFSPGRHHVACALSTANHNIYYGLHLDCAGFDTCAEPIAIANACMAGDMQLRTIVAVAKDRETGNVEVVNPCGNCLQHLIVFAPDVSIIGRTRDGTRMLTVPQMLPYPYRH